MNRLILFLIRCKLRVRKYQYFKFDNQSTDNVYYFSDKHLLKICKGQLLLSNVKLNWLLNKRCKIVVLDKKRQQTLNKKYNKKHNKNYNKNKKST